MLFHHGRLDQYRCSLYHLTVFVFLVVTTAHRPAILKVKRTRKLQAKSGFDLVGLLLLCGYISLNPGPRCKYPCGVYSKAVKCNQRGVQCNCCVIWYHVDCMIYEALANSSCIWECVDCGFPKFSSSLFESLDVVSVTNHFWPLHSHSISSSTSNSTIEFGFPSGQNNSWQNTIGPPQHTSSPKKNRNKPSSAANSKPNQIKVCTINFCSLVSHNKHLNWLKLHQFLETHKPDIVLGCETNLNTETDSREIFPDYYLHRPPNRKDRDTGEKGGGVLIAVKGSISSVEQLSPADYEITWTKISLPGRAILFGSFYHPPKSLIDHFEQPEL